MNRIQLLDQTVSAPRSLRSSRRTRSGAPAKGQGERSFFVPVHYEANYAYPLVVWLHGPCDDHRQLKRVMPHLSVRNYVAVAPSAPIVDLPLAEELDPWRETTAGIAESRERVEQCIEHAMTRFNIAPNRVFLAGFHHGGTMAMRIALSSPERFAGAASVGGPFPVGHHPIARLQESRQLPLLIAYGQESEVYPIQRVCEELRLFHVAGLNVHLRQYPCGHELTTQMMADLNAWMMELVTGVASQADSNPTRYRAEDLN